MSRSSGSRFELTPFHHEPSRRRRIESIQPLHFPSEVWKQRVVCAASGEILRTPSRGSTRPITRKALSWAVEHPHGMSLRGPHRSVSDTLASYGSSLSWFVSHESKPSREVRAHPGCPVGQALSRALSSSSLHVGHRRFNAHRRMIRHLQVHRYACTKRNGMEPSTLFTRRGSSGAAPARCHRRCPRMNTRWVLSSARKLTSSPNKPASMALWSRAHTRGYFPTPTCRVRKSTSRDPASSIASPDFITRRNWAPR
jgi:hypothetical protein